MAQALLPTNASSHRAQPVRRPCVLCQAGPGPSSTRQSASSTAQPEQGRGFARILPALLAAAVTAVAPAAIAVSGGGGLGTALSYKDFSGKSFPQQKFYKAELRGTNFSGADLTGANLYGAYAKDANFKDANMRLTVLESVDFENADLRNAILEGAQITNARFSPSTKIEGSDWTDVIVRKDVQRTLCKLASGTNPKTGVETKESLGCS